MAISSLQAGKTPGPDGFLAELYKIYAEEFAPRFHAMFLTSLRTGSLPTTMSEVVIVVVPKPGKNMDLCTSYHSDQSGLCQAEALVFFFSASFQMEHVFV